MNKHYTSIILILLFVLNTQAQETKESWILSLPESGNKNYVARDYIKLNSGFLYKATEGSSNTFRAGTDACLLFPPTDGTYMKPDGTLTSNPSGAYAVGAIPGQFNVSPSGAASYSIPIEVPAGVNGMQPGISLVYNSQAGNGIAGWGWNIGGVSMISRTTNTSYYNEIVSLFDWSSTCPLLLDGQRLMWTGNAEYRTENESYSKITGHNIQWWWGTEVIKVQTKEGIVYEYGRTGDVASYAAISSIQRLGWMLSKVYDQFGNFIKYNYSYGGGTMYVDGTVLQSVSYGTTLSGTEKTIATISFVYNNRADVEQRYMDVTPIRNSKILTEINVVSSGSTYRKYELKYSLNTIGKNELKEVVCYNGDNEKLNPTKIDWGNINQNMKVSKISTPYGTDEVFFSADVDGDGISELIKAEEITSGYLCTYFRVYKPVIDTAGNTTFEHNTNYVVNATNFQFNHFNSATGAALALKNGNEAPLLYVPTIKSHPNNTTEFILYELTNRGYINFVLKTKTDRIPVYTSGDINNDGYDDFVIIEQFSVNGIYPFYNFPFYIFYGNSEGKIISQELNVTCSTGQPSHLFISDLNSDGLNDILIANDEGFNVLRNIGGNIPQNSILKVVFGAASGGRVIRSTQYSPSIPGDFNGDGLIDFIVNIPQTPNWHFAINNGDFTFSEHALPAITAIEEDFTGRNDDKDRCIVYDFDGDGKDDIVVYESIYREEWKIFLGIKIKKEIVFKSAYVAWYRSTGTGVEQVKRIDTNQEDYFYTKNATVGDFNGDGRADLLNYSSNLYSFEKKDSKVYLHSSFNTNYEGQKVKSITDGMGNKTEFTYRPLSDNSVYLATTFHNYNTPVYRIKGVPLYVLNKTVSTGSGQSFTKTFAYENALVHTTGKGFLGFMTSRVKDMTSGIETETKTAFNNTFQLLTPNTVTRRYGASVIDISTSSVSLETISGKRYKTKLNSVKTEDRLKGTAVTQTFSNYDSFGNPQTIQTNYGGGISETQALTYIQKGSWCSNRIATAEITKQNSSGSQTFATNYTWYNNGKLNTETVHPGSADFKVVTAYEYDTFGNPQKITVSNNGKSRTRQMSYTPSGRFLATDKNVELNETVSYTYNETKAQLLTQIDATGTTRYEYDGFGRLKTTVFPDKTRSVTAYQWAGSGKPTNAIYYVYEETSGQSPVKTWYDRLGRELRRDCYRLNEQWKLITTQYNSKGQLYRISEPHTATASPSQWAQTYAYDSYGRTTSVATPAGTTTYAYNGLTVTETSPRGVTKTETNSAGQTLKSTVNGKYVEYSYYPSGLTKSATPQGGAAVTFEYDLAGNRTKITDPDAGIIETQYNGFGQTVQQKQKIHTAGGDVVTTYGYKPSSGLLEYENVNGRQTNYTYDTRNRLRTVSIANVHSQTFDYDTFNRPVKVTETVEGNKTFVTETGYDAMGRIGREVYPSGFAITSQYDRYGFLKSVADNKGVKVWEAVSANTRGQLTQYKQGGKSTTLGYDDKGRPYYIWSENIIDMDVYFNEDGNVSSRLDGRTGQRDNFSYDAANRLTGWSHLKSGNTVYTTTITYDDATGGIKTKNNVPYQMNYGVAGKPKHAIGSIAGVPQEASAPQNITYTSFNKMLSVTQGNKSHQLLYGINNQRIKGTFKTSGTTKLTRYYTTNYEEEINAAGNVRKLHYINGGNGLAAIMVRNGGVDSLYYTYCDCQGNLLAVTDAAGNVKERYAYDPWGQRINPADWTQKDTRTSLLFSRGYTLHEHLDDFGLINMNGRMYDPLVAQFLSPDPYVQAPGNWFNYNRYAYGMNNPLLYSDPSGEFFWVIPNIGWSKSDGLSIGVSVVVGVPGAASAQAGVGYNFKNNDLYVYAGVSTAFNTVYVSASTQSGFSVGWSAGLSPYTGLPISTNFTSVGYNYNISNNALSGNVSAWSVDKNGWTFNPSVSAMILPEHTTNLVRGKGFNSNQQVFENMLATGDKQAIVDYFGFEGTYNPNIKSKRYNAPSYYGSTNLKTGQISYGDLAFDDYETLKSIYYKELYTHRNVQRGTVAKLPVQEQGVGFDTYLEEIDGYMYAYKNRGLYRNSNKFWNGVELYQRQLNRIDITYSTYPTNRFINFIYRIPRKW